ncbi:hypothetical protein PoB_003961600 [Plakobranchus ocellatus]|uniref:Uncharacterized protein n=1 Tax=Plakobranchus ocellatus TaxID=259542 RepID=A0AAV4B2P3_9GAST|nr:hypothetical protein PoB_003961600 [Plakobranchus ocellatus]
MTSVYVVRIHDCSTRPVNDDTCLCCQNPRLHYPSCKWWHPSMLSESTTALPVQKMETSVYVVRIHDSPTRRVNGDICPCCQNPRRFYLSSPNVNCLCCENPGLHCLSCKK